MRILLTVHQFFPEFRAGTEVLTLSVAKELIRRGHQVHVFTGFPGEIHLSDEERFDEYDYEGIHVYRFHHAYTPMAAQNSMIEVGFNNSLARKFFERILHVFEPNIIHYFHLNRLGVGLINHAFEKNIPQYFTPTDFWMICATAQLMLGEGKYCSGPDAYAGNCIQHFAQDRVNGLSKRLIKYAPTSVFQQLARFTKNNPLIHYPMSSEVNALTSRTQVTTDALNKLKRIFAPNDFMEELFLRYGVKKELILKQPFGINIKENKACKKTSGSRNVTIGFIGTLAPHKGCHILIDAIKKLRHTDLTVEIYGDPNDFPDYSKKLANSVSSRLVSVIEFKGVFPNSEIDSVVSNFDVLVVPSIWYENTPLVIYSAQAAKCPVIGSDLPGIAAAVKHEYNGLLFKAGSVDDLANKLNRFIEDKIAGVLYKSIKPVSIEEYVDVLSKEWEETGL